MDAINLSLFHLLYAGAALSDTELALATLAAEYLIGIVPLLLLILWLRYPEEKVRTRLLGAFFAAMLALGLNQLISLVYYHPRPFMAGLAHAYISHVADSSFPSDHATVIWSVGFALLPARPTRPAGMALCLMGLPVAWARIYLGVHYPLDMAGAVGTAAIAALAVTGAERKIHRFVTRPLLKFCNRLVPPRSHRE